MRARKKHASWRGDIERSAGTCSGLTMAEFNSSLRVSWTRAPAGRGVLVAAVVSASRGSPVGTGIASRAAAGPGAVVAPPDRLELLGLPVAAKYITVHEGGQ